MPLPLFAVIPAVTIPLLLTKAKKWPGVIRVPLWIFTVYCLVVVVMVFPIAYGGVHFTPGHSGQISGPHFIPGPHHRIGR